MIRFLRRKPASISRSPGAWLMLVLLFVVLVPSAGLLWFLNQAMEREQFAARQKLVDAYRAQLTATEVRFQEKWRDRLAQVEWTSVTSGGVIFRQVLQLDLGDAAVVYDHASGNRTYPDAPPPPQPPVSDPAWTEAAALESEDPAAAAAAYGAIAAAQTLEPQLARHDSTRATIAARALQAQARCLIRAGDRTGAFAVLDTLWQQEQFRRAKDPQGRAIAPNAALLAAELVSDSDPPRAAGIREQLRLNLLNKFQAMEVPSSQVRFLLRELESHTTDTFSSRLLAAEDLAAAFIANHQPVQQGGLRPSPMKGVWQYQVPGQSYVILHREENLPHRLRKISELPALPEDIRLEFLPPGHEPEGLLLAQPLGETLPGWRLGITPANLRALETATRERIQLYTGVVILLVVSLVVVASLAWGLIRRQMALTQLRNDLVANVTHELKTPLASMRLLVDTLLHAPRFDATRTREYLQMIATENLRLSRLIGNFLTFSRIERNKYTFDFRPVPARELVDGAVTAVRDRFQAPDCQLDVHAPAELPTVDADADAVITALVNLLDNAWKYSGETKHVVLQAGAHNGSVTFAVRDQGIGMEPREAQRIFQRFYQIRQPRSTGGGGAGLGLSIVQFIVQAHRGTIDVQSAPERGSTFTITLPAAESTDRPS